MIGRADYKAKKGLIRVVARETGEGSVMDIRKEESKKKKGGIDFLEYHLEAHQSRTERG